MSFHPNTFMNVISSTNDGIPWHLMMKSNSSNKISFKISSCPQNMVWFISWFHAFKSIQISMDEQPWNIICEFSMNEWMNFQGWRIELSWMQFYEFSFIHEVHHKKYSVLNFIHKNSSKFLGVFQTTMTCQICFNYHKLLLQQMHQYKCINLPIKYKVKTICNEISYTTFFPHLANSQLTFKIIHYDHGKRSWQYVGYHSMATWNHCQCLMTIEIIITSSWQPN